MNAIRSLPILNRPSRPGSPTQHLSTDSATVSTSTRTPSSGGKPRALSRQITEKVAGLHISTNMPPPPNHVSPSMYSATPLSKKPSPPSSRPGTPASGGPNHMDIIGLRLNEAVNKACMGVDYATKKDFKSGVGWHLGETVIK